MRAAPHPRTVLLLLLAALAASFASWRSAIVVLVCLVAGGPVPRGLGLRALSLVGSLVGVLVVLPFAPWAVADVTLRGVAASLTLAFHTSSMTWPAAIAELQALGLPRVGVAFLALLARHVEVMTGEAKTVMSVLRVRGAFDRGGNRPRAVAVLLSRLLALAWLRADRVADAMALRGFEGRLPPNARWRVRFSETPQYAAACTMALAAAWELAR